MTVDANKQVTGEIPFTELWPIERKTLPELFFYGIENFASTPAFLIKEEKEWVPYAHAEVLKRVVALARAMKVFGLNRGDRIAILSENRLEWALTDYAAQCLGIVDVPIYPTLPADQIAYILHDAGIRLAFVSSSEQWNKLSKVREQIPTMERVISYDHPGEVEGVTFLADFTEEAHRLQLDDPVSWLWEHSGDVKQEDVATIIYTSGTTGPPKGVMITHLNLAGMVVATKQHGSLPLEEGDVALSFLPLSHIFERAVCYYYWDCGTTIAYAESTNKVSANLREVRPHTMVSVPRVFEVVYSSIMNATGNRLKLIQKAAQVGGSVADLRLAGKAVPAWSRLQYAVMDRLVFSKIRQAVGGRVKVFICGGAPLSPEIARFFLAAGLTILEGYGLTETAPVLTANRPKDMRLGTVGIPYPGVQLRIGAQGEILAQTPGLMKGYWNLPEATAATVDADGWFHTGDIGEFDSDGFLTITDRLKDLIVTTGGKNIAPQPLEAKVQESPFVARAVMIGDRRPYPILLIEPYIDKLKAWCKTEGIQFMELPQLIQHEKVLQLFKREALGALRNYASYQRPKKIALLPDALTVESGFLTPSLKVRRRIVEQHFADLIESLYR